MRRSAAKRAAAAGAAVLFVSLATVASAMQFTP
jgi:hypothetical protein